jgi:hypothetical protein
MKQIEITLHVVGASHSFGFYLNQENEYGERNFDNRGKLLISKRELKKIFLESEGLKIPLKNIEIVEIGNL